eukprot:TRINITY_DN39412_c0_g1_i1.p1 TRINITY_DN39412_c0_g1~~TRINITY_DN39412_c0_g1_i1.p1  ORF type:complete len:305 (-),score=52.41 TRINITY_DN39412_c0_g1_i1:216-1130(-)
MASADAFDWRNGWCATHEVICPRMWGCGFPGFFSALLACTLAWLTLFYGAAMLAYPMVQPLLRKRLPSSRPGQEDTPYWFAWHVVSLAHCSLIAALSIPPVYRLAFADDAVRFGSPRAPSATEYLAEVTTLTNCAFLFSSFVVYDLVVMSVHKLAGLDMVIHHCVFVFFSAFISYDCFLFQPVGVMLTMESSTIFLNYYSFFRFRLGFEDWTVKTSFGLFGATYLLFRIVGMAWVLTTFSRALVGSTDIWELSGNGGIPFWHLCFVLLGMLGAFSLQLMWMLRSMGPRMLTLLRQQLRPGKVAE